MRKLGPKAQNAIKEVLARFEGGDLSPGTEVIRIRRKGGDEAPAEPPASAVSC